MPRYELSEGSSHKFWEIELDGKAFTTKWGRIGSAGQSTTKKFGSPSQAAKEYEKLIAEKTAKGYRSPGKRGKATGDGRGSVRAAEVRNPELEQAILADPDDEDAYLVYADWLQGQGDPRGELITLSAQAAKAPKNAKNRKLKAAADKLFAQHEAHFLGPLARYRKTLDGTETRTMTWRWGFVASLRIAFDRYALEYGPSPPSKEELKTIDLGKVLATFLAHPSCRFLTDLVVGINRQDRGEEYQSVVNALARCPPPTLRSLFVGDFDYHRVTQISWNKLGDFGKLWPELAGLRKLILQGGSFKLGTVDLPELRHAEFRTGGLSRKSIKSIVNARWPRLEHLEIWFGMRSYGAEGNLDAIKPLLDGKGLPALRHLALKNCEFTDDIARVIGKSKILPQLETLDLSTGTLSDAGVDALVTNKAAFAKLRRLNVSESFISDAGRRRLKGLCRGLEAGDQRRADEYNGEVHRYATVGE